MRYATEGVQARGVETTVHVAKMLAVPAARGAPPPKNGAPAAAAGGDANNAGFTGGPRVLVLAVGPAHFAHLAVALSEIGVRCVGCGQAISPR